MVAKAKAKNVGINKADLAANYGFALAVLNSNPELAGIFEQATRTGPGGTWSPAKFQAAVMNSRWFKTQAATTREWLVLQESDPATAAARRKARAVTISQAAAQMGVRLSTAQLRDIRDHSLLLGWTDAQVQQSISADWKWNPTTSAAGQAAKTIDQIRSDAAAYAVPVSNKAIHDWTAGVLSGTHTADDFTEYAKTQAKSLYGADVARAIDAGQTVEQYADPYKQLAVQNLGINPDSVNWTDPKWTRFLNNTDPKTGLRSGPLSLSDAVTVMRTDPKYGYDTSAVGKQQAAQFATQLGQRLGAI